MSGIDDVFRLEAIYYSAPFPRDLRTLTVLGIVFDKIYFPGVSMPKGEFDEIELDKEIVRLETMQTNFDIGPIVKALKVAKFAGALEGLLEFTGTSNDHLHHFKQVPVNLLEATYEAIYGPLIKANAGNSGKFKKAKPEFGLIGKKIPGSNASIKFPVLGNYLAGAIFESAKKGIPLLNDMPGMTVPGVEEMLPTDRAKVLSTILAIECTKLILPPTPVLRVRDILEFRTENEPLLRAFRRSMLRYAADLNRQIDGLALDDFKNKTRFFIETEIVPTMDALRETMNDPARPWHKRAVDAIKVIPSIGGAYFAGGTTAMITKIVSSFAPLFFAETSAHGDKKEALKRSGLYYLLKLENFHRDR